MSRGVLDEVNPPRRIIVVLKSMDGTTLDTILLEENDDEDRAKGVIMGKIDKAFMSIPR